MDIRKVRILALPALLALGACASTPGLSQSEKLALYQANAGPPVQSFSMDDFDFDGGIDGWTALGDSALAVWTGPGEAWLLTLNAPCTNLDFAQDIYLTNSGGMVFARLDKVVPRGIGLMPSPMPCYIQQIQPLDVKGLQRTEKELRQLQMQEREASQGTQTSP